MPHSIEIELQKATSLKPKGKEERAKYLDRLVTSVGELDDSDFGKLTKDAKDWVNGVVKKYVNKGKPIPDFEEEEAEEVKAKGNGKAKVKPAEAKKKAKPADDDEDEDEAPKAKAKAKAKDDDEDDETRSSGRVRHPRPLGKSAQTELKRFIYKDPTLTPTDLLAKLAKVGMSCSSNSVSTIRSDLRHSIRVAQDMNIDVRTLVL